MPKKDYSNWSKEELFREIKKLEKRKKYGIVWDEERTKEKFEKEAEGNLPVLKEVKNKEIKTDEKKPINILIEGDNFHALSVLNYTHKGLVDVICIDPPYNTGNEGFRYNDKIVNSEDPYRHSKWLSFMSKRLKLAKNILSERGVMFINIDDNEMAKLRLLCDEIFGENHVDVMIWRKSGYGREGKMKNVTTFRKDHEYIIVCFKRERNLNQIRETPDFKGEYGNPDNDPRGDWLSGSISRADYASDPNHKNYYTVVSPSGKKITRQFEISKSDFEKLDKDGRIYWGEGRGNVPRIKIFLTEEREITPYSVLMKGTTTEGTYEVGNILNQDFTTLRPKPVLLIKTIIQLASRKDSVILDFFAGSGTTGHAVLELNNKDGGQRKFILCTNNEGNICTDVCYPRIEKVMKGYRGHLDKQRYEGLGSNLKYFKTIFVHGEPTDKNKKELVDQSTEMLCLGENCFDGIKSGKHFKIFKNNDNKYLGIVYDDKGIEPFKKEVKKLGQKINVYVFSLDESAREEEFEDIKNKVNLKPIPEVILNVYRRIFK